MGIEKENLFQSLNKWYNRTDIIYSVFVRNTMFYEPHPKAAAWMRQRYFGIATLHLWSRVFFFAKKLETIIKEERAMQDTFAI